MTGFDLDRAWDLHPQVSVRPEPFGALLYHFGTRRLSFLKDRVLLDVVRALGSAPDARAACAAAGVTGEVTYVDAGYNILGMTGLETGGSDE